MAIDWTDPCARAEALRSAYYALLSGRAEVEIEYSAAGVTRRTRFERGGDLNRLFAAWQSAEAECGAVPIAPSAPLNVVVRSTKGW